MNSVTFVLLLCARLMEKTCLGICAMIKVSAFTSASKTFIAVLYFRVHIHELTN